MRIGITAGACYYKDGKIDFKRIKEDGFDCLDFGEFMSPQSTLYSISEEELYTTLSLVRDDAITNGITINQIHGVWPFDDVSEKDWNESLAYYKRAIIGAKILGSKYLVVHHKMPFGCGSCGSNEDELKNINIEYFKRLVPFAEESGVTICLENLPFMMDACKVEGTIEIIKGVNSKNFGMCLDTGHACFHKDDAYTDVKKIGKLLKAVHMHDNNGWSDSHSYPYYGVFDWDGFVRGLKEIGYCGVMSLETNASSRLPEDILNDEMKILGRIARFLADKFDRL